MRSWQHAVDTGETSPLLRDWVAWLTLSRTPDYAARSEPMKLLHVQRGVIVDALEWPPERGPRIYAAFDDAEAVYVGQTGRPLAHRIRDHFSNRSTLQQREKAGTWEFVVSVAFEDLRHGDLDQLETSAADWILPRRRQTGRRHPRGVGGPRAAR